MNYKRADIAATKSISMLYYYDAGITLGFTVEIIDPKKYIIFKKNNITFSLHMNLLPTNSHVGSVTSINKHLSTTLLRHYNIPAPEGQIFGNWKDAYEYSQKFKSSVIKPANNFGGKGVTINPVGLNAFKKAFKYAQGHTEWTKEILVEQLLKGKDYRVLVAGNKVIGVTLRHPPMVKGDGELTVRQLIHKENDRRIKLRKSEHIYDIPIDNEIKKSIAEKGYTLSSIIPRGRKFALRQNGSISTGGSSENCTHKIHPSMANICIKAAHIIGLDVAGVDLIVPNISTQYTTGGIIEINDNPGLGNHENPHKGKPQKVSIDIIKHIYKKYKRQTI